MATSKSKTIFVINKKGFFEMPYWGNSPKDMIDSLKNLPFIKYNSLNQSFSSKTPYFKTITWYREIEEGLFIVHSQIKFKVNVSFKYCYDKTKPSEHYSLSLRVDSLKRINSLAGDTGYTNNCWLIFKPKAGVDHHHFKGTTGKYFTVYFTPQWLKKYLGQANKKKVNELRLFLQSQRDHLICPHLPGDLIHDTDNLRRMVTEESAGKKQLSKLKVEILDFIAFFTAKMQSEKIDEKHFEISSSERLKVLQGEHILRDHKFKKFPGIAQVAKEVGLSETKLKECFKIVYDKTLFRYFQSLQMEEAKELIIGSKLPIARIAHKLAYQNASKFSTVFKEYHGHLPSETKRGA